MTTGSRAVELVARASYGRLLALLASRARDIHAAEDALSEALIAALTQWAEQGVPDNPDAWLLTAARRRLIDQRRRALVRRRDAEAVAHSLEQLAKDSKESDTVFRDERLRLLFVCTHPAIDPSVRVPLMLQTVMGLDAVAIGSAMRVAPKTMGQRLWRAKSKIQQAAIPFEVPSKETLPERLDAVLEGIYAAFGTAWEDTQNADVRLRGLTEEAIFLARLLVTLLPDEPEPRGLLSLMLFAEARRPARRSPSGAYVPLENQDHSLWLEPHLVEAEHMLRAAFPMDHIGPFQLEAALQSAHVSGVRRGQRDIEAVLVLYEGLVALAPSLGARVGRAAALVDAGRGNEALVALEAIPSDLAADYQPWWAVRAAAFRAARRWHEAREAFERASALTEDAAVRRFLIQRAVEAAQAANVDGP